jgi:hypothetical protein
MGPLLEDSQGSDFLPPMEDCDSQTSYVTPEPPSDGLDQVHLEDVSKVPTKPEVDQAKIDAMRARCQSVRSDYTSRRGIF